MKALKTITLFLLVATGVLSQPTPNDMFVSGHVLDQNGNVQVNHEVCVGYVSNNPSLPSDTICTTTNANGYYSITVVNGSLTGPNVSFEVSTYDPCALLPVVQTVDNQQGTVDSVNVDFVICSTGGCSASFATSGPDSLGQYRFSADVESQDWDYAWTVDNLVLSTVSELQTTLSSGVQEVCLTVTDSADNCTDTQCQTIVSGCDASFATSGPDSLGQYTFSADVESQDWDYAWTVDNLVLSTVSELQTTLSSGVQEVCLTVTDSADNCTDTQCQTIVSGCDASFATSGPDSLGQYTFSADAQVQDWGYAWTVDNLVISTVSELQTTPANGTYEVCLTVTDSVSNCSDTLCETITVNNNICYGYVSGQIYAGTNNQPLNNGVVYLITFDSTTNMLAAVSNMTLGPDNSYQFGPLVCGDYMVKAAADTNSQYYSTHIPTYHDNSPFWASAQTITLSQVNTQVTADVLLIPANNPGGPGFIGGDVTEGANKMDPGDPVSGIQVNLFDLNGNAIAYTYTDGNGEFGFDDLAFGTYQVYVEVLGVPTIPAYVTIGPDNPTVEDVHIYATYELISTWIEEFDFDGAINEVYPNPAGDEAWISFNLETEVTVDINILDLTGRSVSTTTRSISRGENQVRIDVDDLTDGYYFLNIQDAEGVFSVTRKFMKVD